MDNKIVFWGLVAVCSVYAFLRGGGPERAGAAIITIGSIVSVIAGSAAPIRFQNFEVGMFIVDLVVLAAFVFLALTADRFWPIWIASIQVLGVAAHIAKVLKPDVMPFAYAAVLALGVYPMLVILAAGTRRHQKRLRTFGADDSWRPCFAGSILTRHESGRPS